MTKRAVIYCRVSSPEQVKNNSLESQEKRCSEYCKREGYEIDKVFVEEGESAKTANRTELKNLLAYCSANRKKINVVVFDDVTRWSRKSFDYQFAKAQLKKLGIELKSPSVKIEDTPQSNMIENLLVAVGQFDNDTKAVQTVERMKLLSERGQKNHKAPLGYINCKDPLGKKIIKPDEKTAPFIQRAFESFSKGVQTKQAILDELTGRGFRNQRGKHVSPQTFYKLLRNETYAGWNVEKKWGGRYRGNWIPIITDETFQRVQALLDGKGFQASKKRDNPDFPFRGMVICGECKRPLTASFSTGKNKNKSYGYYFCQNKNCRKVKFRKEQIEENMLGFLRLIKFREEDVLEFGKKFVENLKIKRTQALGDIQTLKDNIEALGKQKIAYSQAHFIEKKLDEKTYQEIVNHINQEVGRANTEITKIEVPEIDVDGIVSHLLNSLEHLDEIFLNGSIEQKRALIRLIWPDGEVEVLGFSDKDLEENSKRVGSIYGDYQTLETPVIIKAIKDHSVLKTNLVAPRGIEPRFNG